VATPALGASRRRREGGTGEEEVRAPGLAEEKEDRYWYVE